MDVSSVFYFCFYRRFHKHNMAGGNGWNDRFTDEEPFSDGPQTTPSTTTRANPPEPYVDEFQSRLEDYIQGSRISAKDFWSCFRVLRITVGCVILLFMLAVLRATARHKSTQQEITPQPSHQQSNHTTGQEIGYELSLQELYPEISAKPGSECHAAWTALQSLPCHDAILNHKLDIGSIRKPASGANYFIPKICDSRCNPSLSTAYEAVQASCTASDTFNLDDYDGLFDPTLLEDGPVAALKGLMRRNDHFCHQSSARHSSVDYESCPLETLARFWISDSLRPDLGGIDSFIGRTAETRREFARKTFGVDGELNGIQVTEESKSGAKLQTYGPGSGETSCSWCTFDFLDRTLNSWEEGAFLDTGSGSSVPLQDFILRVKEAGDRCARASVWGKIYNKAVQQYQASGLLPSDWETIPPVDDLDWLLTHGPTKSDWPVSEITAEIARLESGKDLGDITLSTPADDVPELLNRSISCLSAISRLYTSAPCYINLSREQVADIGRRKETQPELLLAYCGHECSSIIDGMWPPPDCLNGPFTTNLANAYFWYWAGQGLRLEYCATFGQDSTLEDCAPGSGYIGRNGWASNGRPKSPVLIAQIDAELQILKSERALADSYLDLGRKSHRTLNDGLQKAGGDRGDREIQSRLADTVCSRCLWNWVAGRDATETMRYMKQATSPSGYIEFVKRYHATCTGLGASWMGGTPYGDDQVIWRERKTSGEVMRYIHSDLRDASLRVYGVNEADGQVSDDDLELGQVTLWHVLLTERRLKALTGGRVEWEAEAEHRRNADAKIWDSSGPLHEMKYIGPKGDVPEKRDGP